MKEMYDIEEFIKLKVKDHVSEVSPHIWDNIERSQSPSSKFFGFLRSNWRLSSFLVALFGLVALMLLHQYGDYLEQSSKSIYLEDSHSVITGENSPINAQESNLSSNQNVTESEHQISHKNLDAIATILPENQTIQNNHNSSTATSTHVINAQVEQTSNFSSFSQFTTNQKNTLASENTTTSSSNDFQSRLMELNRDWAGPGRMRDKNGKLVYPHGPSVKYYIPIPEFDYRKLSVDELPEELDVIPMQENILQVKDASTDKSQIMEEEMEESLLESRMGMGAELANLKTKEQERGKKEKEKKTPPKKPKKDKNPWLWLDIVAAPSYIIKNINTYNPDYNRYLAERHLSEQSRFGYTIGFRTSFRLHDVSEIRTGLLYSRITENFEYQSKNDPNSPVVSHRNKYHFIDIPLLIGYREDRKEFDFNINLGAMINLSFMQEGLILDAVNQETIVDLNETSLGPVFRSSAGLSLFGSIGYNYKFSDKVHLLLEPSLKYMVRPVNSYDFPIRQRFHMFGITTGLRMNIGN